MEDNNQVVVMTNEQQELAMQYMNLANIYAASYRNYPFYEDILQEMRYWICYSVANWKENKGSKLSSYIITMLKYKAGRFVKKYYNNTDTQKWRTTYLEDELEGVPENIQDLRYINDLSEDYVSRYMETEWLPQVLDKIYKENRTSFLHRQIYNDYINVMKKGRVAGLQVKIAKKYNITKQAVNRVIKTYNNILKNKWEELL